jgi:hypothetical protein
MRVPASAAAEGFDEVAQAHSATAVKLESHCRPDRLDQADLPGRPDVERSLADTATGRAEEARRLP